MNKKVLVLGFNLKTYFCKQFGMKIEENEEFEVFENDHLLLYKPYGLRSNYSDADRIRLKNYLQVENGYHQIFLVCQFGRFDQIFFIVKEFYNFFKYYFSIVTLIIMETEQPFIELEDQLYLNENLLNKFNLNTILYYSEIEKKHVQVQIQSIINKQEIVNLNIDLLTLHQEQNIDYQLLNLLKQFNNHISMNSEDNDIQQEQSIDTVNNEKQNKQFEFYGCFY